MIKHFTCSSQRCTCETKVRFLICVRFIIVFSLSIQVSVQLANAIWLSDCIAYTMYWRIPGTGLLRSDLMFFYRFDYAGQLIC